MLSLEHGDGVKPALTFRFKFLAPTFKYVLYFYFL